jgi:two-component system, NtrC family, response regulator HupR/HoxA
MTERNLILVVDDEPLNRELLRRFLHRDHEVIEADGVDQALSMLESTSADVKLIVCDYLMPGRSGVDLATEVRRRWPRIPVMLLTGFEGSDDVQAALDDGLVHRLMTKPWRGAQLRAVVEEMLAGPAPTSP